MRLEHMHAPAHRALNYDTPALTRGHVMGYYSGMPKVDLFSWGKSCGAKTRKGTPCRCQPFSLVTGNGRCKFHGGMSTGPKTVEGRERALKALAKGWRPGVPRPRRRREPQS